MSQHATLLHVDHAHGVDPRLRHQQPSRFFVIREADRQHPAIPLQPRDANRDLGFHRRSLGVDYRDGIVVGVRDEHAPGRGQDPRRTAAPMHILPERQTCADEGLHFRRRGSRNIDHAHRVGFADVRVAQAGDFDRSPDGSPLGSGGGFGAGKSEGRKGQPRGARLLHIGAGDRLIFKHAQVGDVEFAPVGGKRHGEGQAPDFY